MFYLRRIHKETKRESNFTLGKNYATFHKDTATEEFNKLLKDMSWMSDWAIENCFCIISDESGQFHPLFHTSDNYIVTDKGSTYARIM